MTFRLTLQCSEECKHCLVNALPNSGSMSYEVLDKCLELVKYSNIPVLNLSGGEITEMEGWQDMVRYIADFIVVNGLRTRLILLSNGTFLLRGLMNEMSRLLDHPAIAQLYLSTNPRFYKDHEAVHRALTKWNHIKLYINKYDRNEVLKNIGRARNLDTNLKTPASCTCFWDTIKCFSRQYKTLAELLNAIPPGQCSPMINIDGSIHAGWGIECTSIGTVFDEYEVLLKRMIGFVPCGSCGQIMPTNHISYPQNP